MASKKGRTTNFLRSLLFVDVFQFLDPRSGMENNLDLGSGTNIPDLRNADFLDAFFIFLSDTVYGSGT